MSFSFASISKKEAYCLFLPLFVHRVLATPFAPFLDFDFSLYFPAIFPTPVINTFTGGAGEANEIIL